MQLLANSEKGPIHCKDALPQKNYQCLECRSIVRIREGFRRQRHFYHIHSNRLCRQNGKSLTHIQNQMTIQKMIGPNCQLEVPFPIIQRVADCVWREKKIIFEVQCSPISIHELLSRNVDYNYLGYQVVWILHSHRYGKRKISPVENILRYRPHYFTNIDENGKGFIYDMFDNHNEGFRSFLLKTPPIDLLNPRPNFFRKKNPETKFVRNRRLGWPIYFKGDFYDKLMNNKNLNIQFQKYEPSKKSLLQIVKQRYRLWLDQKLQQASLS